MAAPFRIISLGQARSASVRKAASYFAKLRLTALLVSDEGGTGQGQGGDGGLGIFTEHDIVKLVAQQGDGEGSNAKTVTIAEAMTRNPVCVCKGIPRASALALMRAAKFRHLPLLDASGRVVGVLDVVTLGRALFAEQKSLSAVFRQKVQMMFSFAKSFQSRVFSSAANDLSTNDTPSRGEHEEDESSSGGWDELASKGQKLLVMRPEDTVMMAAQAMISEGVSALLVEDPADGSLAGIVTESDIVRRVVARGADSSATQLCVIMTQSPTTVRVDSSDPADSPMSALSLMFDKKFRHLPMVISETQRPHGVLDILRLCQGVFGSKLQESNTGTNGGESCADNREPSAWIVRGLECFHSRARAAAAAAAAEMLVNGDQDEYDDVVQEEVEDKPAPPLPTTGTAAASAEPQPAHSSMPSAPMAATPNPGAAVEAATAAVAARTDRFRSYMGKARNKSMKAEKAAQGVDFGSAIKQFGLALHFVALAQKQLTSCSGGIDGSVDNSTLPAHDNMTMAVRAASIDIRLRRIGAYRIDGNTEEALEDAEMILATFSNATAPCGLSAHACKA